MHFFLNRVSNLPSSALSRIAHLTIRRVLAGALVLSSGAPFAITATENEPTAIRTFANDPFMAELGVQTQIWQSAKDNIQATKVNNASLERLYDASVNLSDAMAQQRKRDKLHLLDNAYKIIITRARAHQDNTRLQNMVRLNLNGDARQQDDDPHNLIERYHHLNELILKITLQLENLSPDSTRWQTNEALAHLRIAKRYELWSGAEPHITAALTILQPLANANLKDLSIQSALALALQYKAGKLYAGHDAQLARGKELLLRREILRQSPDEAHWQYELAMCLQRFGNLVALPELPDSDCLIAFEEATELFEKLLHQQPKNVQYQQDFAQLKLDYAMLLNDKRLEPNAVQHREALLYDVLSIRQSLLEQNRLEPLYQADWLQAYENLRSTNKTREQVLQDALTYLQNMAKRYPAEKEWIGLQLPFLYAIGGIYEETYNGALRNIQLKLLPMDDQPKDADVMKIAEAKMTSVDQDIEVATVKFLALLETK